ncbi:MAG: hypothetical protein AAGA66_04040 [Bacteroidota bacterium]
MFIQIIEYKEQPILYSDYTNCKAEELIEKLNEAAAYFRSHLSKPVLTLSDFSGSFGSKEFMSEAARLNKEIFDEKTIKGAVLGITGVKKILLDGYNTFGKTKLKPFKSKQDALDYLTR